MDLMADIDLAIKAHAVDVAAQTRRCSTRCRGSTCRTSAPTATATLANGCMALAYRQTTA